MDREAEKIRARRHRESKRYAQVRKCEGTSKSMGVKGGRWLINPGDFDSLAKGFRRRVLARIRLAEQAA
jgi:hypothetical protein